MRRIPAPSDGSLVTGCLQAGDAPPGTYIDGEDSAMYVKALTEALYNYLPEGGVTSQILKGLVVVLEESNPKRVGRIAPEEQERRTTTPTVVPSPPQSDRTMTREESNQHLSLIRDHVDLMRGVVRLIGAVNGRMYPGVIPPDPPPAGVGGGASEEQPRLGGCKHKEG